MFFFTLLKYKENESRGSSRGALNDNSRKTSTTHVPQTPEYTSSKRSRALSAPYLTPYPHKYDKRRNNSCSDNSDAGTMKI